MFLPLFFACLLFFLTTLLIRCLHYLVRQMEALKTTGGVGQINPNSKSSKNPSPSPIALPTSNSTPSGQPESKPQPIPKHIQIQPTARIRTGSSSEGGNNGTSLLESNHRIKRESVSSDAEYSEPNENLQVQIVKFENSTTNSNKSLLSTASTTLTTNTSTAASGSIIVSRNEGTTLLQQPAITLAAKQVYKQQNNKNSLLGPPAKRKRICESGVTIIAANVSSLIGK